MIHPDRERILKGPQLHFVIVARIEQSDRFALIEPFLELFCLDLWRRSSRRVDPRHTKCNDLPFQTHEHAIKRLMVTFAYFRLQVLQAGQRPEFSDEQIDLLWWARDE